MKFSRVLPISFLNFGDLKSIMVRVFTTDDGKTLQMGHFFLHRELVYQLTTVLVFLALISSSIK